METETLSNYKHVQDKHLLDKPMEENSIGNDEELAENEIRPLENSTELVDNSSNTCDESNDLKNKDNKNSNRTENIDKQNLSDESDNDVDEEEEHIPLNISHANSDSDKSDDDLDESDLLQEDEEKIDLETNDPLDNNDSSVTEIQEDKDLSSEKCLENEKAEKESSPVSDDCHKDKEADKDNCDPVNDNSHNIFPEEEKQNDNKGNEQEDPISVTTTIRNSDPEGEVDNKTDPLVERTTKMDTVDNDKCDDRKEDTSTQVIEVITGDKSQETESMNEVVEKDPLSPDVEKPKKYDDTDEKEPKKCDDTDEKEPKKCDDTDEKEPKKCDDTDEKEPKKCDDTDEKEPKKCDDTDEKEPKKCDDTDEKEPKKCDDTDEKERKDEEPIKDIQTSLLKETLTRDRNDEGAKDNEAEEDLEMDEDFDPSLLCPDINMEVDEAPVITSSDAPPPARNSDDGNKSPLLYEPIFSTYVDEMTGAEIHFDLTPEEEALRMSSFGEKNPVQYTKIHCTACNVHLGSALDGQGNRFVHPLLKVLICKNCYHFYTSGEFEKDEDGSELYCRWCGQGGQVMCCSGCEMVFCKKCIRINFDRKKLAEIRDSDDWFCFRCNPSQITFQRVHCAEFMEYVRRETQRASTLENPIAYMNVDYTQCCTPQKKKPAESTPTEQPKKKKRKTTVDPDYDPNKERDTSSPQPSTSGYKPPPSTTTTTIPKPNSLVLIAPKPSEPNTTNTILLNTNSSFKIGGTTFKPRTNTITTTPRIIGNLAPVTAVRGRPPTPSPGYIKILPGGIRVPGNAPKQSYTPRPRTPVVTPIRPAVPTPMKHEWFEKTVRAAARVNSNLSYTLTQLNRAQANATSVEALAVVHNKLQEILSTSINSLIQIRKNLRTEFISGIKNIRFPPKPQIPTTTSTSTITVTTPKSTTSSQDDDVIFVSPTASPVPPPMTTTATPVTLASSMNLPPSVTLFKKSTPESSTPTSNTNQPQNGTGVPRSFLRVKSLTALQSVPSECITIPDDPPPPPLIAIPKKVVETPKEKVKDTIEILDEKEEEPVKTKAVNGLGNVKSTIEIAVKNNQLESNTDGKENISRENETTAANDESIIKTYSLKDPTSPELAKMKNTRVMLRRSPEIDELVQSKFGKINGDLEV